MTRSPLRALAGALLAVAVSGSLLAATPTAADAASSRPAVGDCHSMTWAEYQAATDTDAPISCERAHTSRTVAVKDVTSADFRTDEAVVKAGVRVCSPSVARAIGGSERNRKLTAYSLTFYQPTKAQLQAGARWIRCDLVLLGGNRLLPLPTDEEPAVGSAPHADSVARCLREFRAGPLVTACSESHHYRAKGTVQVQGPAYPGNDRLYRIAQQRCPGIAGRTWYATWPGETSWTQGKERHLVCYRAQSS